MSWLVSFCNDNYPIEMTGLFDTHTFTTDVYDEQRIIVYTRFREMAIGVKLALAGHV